jgi:hypothetical protein
MGRACPGGGPASAYEGKERGCSSRAASRIWQNRVRIGADPLTCWHRRGSTARSSPTQMACPPASVLRAGVARMVPTWLASVATFSLSGAATLATVILNGGDCGFVEDNVGKRLILVGLRRIPNDRGELCLFFVGTRRRKARGGEPRSPHQLGTHVLHGSRHDAVRLASARTASIAEAHAHEVGDVLLAPVILPTVGSLKWDLASACPIRSVLRSRHSDQGNFLNDPRPQGLRKSLGAAGAVVRP